jgi:NAD(P)-dependent dehydrogenase (short-subunit alcohol dehydrogenase family)
MAGQFESLVQTFRAQNKTAFILGYTGEVGKELVKAVVSSNVFAKVVLIGRRTVRYEDEMLKDVVGYLFLWMTGNISCSVMNTNDYHVL